MDSKIIFIHGLESNSQGFKGKFLRERFPNIITPDFSGSLDDELQQLTEIITKSGSNDTKWTIIGSSFGGLVATVFTLGYPELVKKLILLAPAFNMQNLDAITVQPLDIPVILYHGSKDDIVPVEPIKKTAEKLFKNLEYHLVDDDHRLHATTEKIDWKSILE